MKFYCEECKKELPDDIPILVDGDGLSPLNFCSWECLMKYAVLKNNQVHQTSQG